MSEPAQPRPGRGRALLAPAVVFLLALALLGLYAKATGPAFDELARLAAADRAAEVVKRVAAHGFSELATPESKQALGGSGALASLLSAWSKLSVGRFLDPLVAARLPFVLLAALASAALFVLVRPSRGLGVASLACLALLAMPRWLHAVVVQSDGALLACVWVIVLACYVRSLGPAQLRGSLPSQRRGLGWAVAGAVALGVGVALSLASAWLLVPLCLHFALARAPSTRRLLRRGRVPVPTLVILALPLVPALLLGLSPVYWRATGAVVASHLLAPLTPSIAATEYAGRVVAAAPVPGGFAWNWLMLTVPAAMSSSALAGAVVVLREPLARRFASGRLRPPPDRHAVGVLALVVLAAVLGGNAFAPAVLTTFPPRTELALPFIALLAALGLDFVARRASHSRLVQVSLAALGLGWVALALARPATASLEFTPLFGGARQVAPKHALPVGDGSELAALAPALGRLGANPVRLTLPREVPAELFAVLHAAGRLEPNVVAAPGGASLVRGAAPGPHLAEVRRDGVVVWSLLAH